MPGHPGHGWDCLSPPFPVDQENRIDKIVGSEPVLAHQPAREVAAPHAAHAHGGKAAIHLHDVSFFLKWINRL
jgi:hypothetical protein